MGAASPPASTVDGPASLARFEPWDGSTYYDRAQLKAAPFENVVVGGYIVLAGLSGSSAILATLAERSGRPGLEALVRRGRLLSLLAPTVGSALLVYDLHTPKRFYNMLRVAKATSPMSIGTWILMGFGGAAGLAAIARLASDRWPALPFANRVARGAGVPAAVLGAGLSTYTAALLSATSTPLWAAAPRGLAIRFGASAMASAAAAMTLGERDGEVRSALEGVLATALVAEFVATKVNERTYIEAEVEGALAGISGTIDRWGGTRLGVLLPLGLLALSAMTRRRRGRWTDAACLAVLGGAFAMRTAVMSAGDRSANRADVSFRFSQPKHLPERRAGRS